MLLCERAQRAEPLYRYTYSNSSTAAELCTSKYVVVEPRPQDSTAQHSTAVAQSPLHNASKDQVRADQSTYQKKSRLFPWSMELLAFASRLRAPNMLDNLTTSVVIPVHSSLRASVAGGTLYSLTRFPFGTWLT